jgi:hypothetical protein
VDIAGPSRELSAITGGVMRRSRYALLIAGLGAAGLVAALPAQQGGGQAAQQPRVIVYKTPT